jgi:hypothetical protein
MSDRVPSYRCKKANGRKYGCVSLPDGLGGRKDMLLGKYGTRESRTEFARIITEWEAAGRRLPQAKAASDITVNELLVLFMEHAEQPYRHADGSPTGELDSFRVSVRPLKALYGETLARDFGPLALKALREKFIHQPVVVKVKVVNEKTGKREWQDKVIRQGLARGVVNQRICRIRKVFKWAVSNELVPPAVYQGLAAVTGLQRGRTAARATEPVRPVSEALMNDTLPLLLPMVADMIRVLQLTGYRAGELVRLRHRHDRSHLAIPAVAS